MEPKDLSRKDFTSRKAWLAYLEQRNDTEAFKERVQSEMEFRQKEENASRINLEIHKWYVRNMTIAFVVFVILIILSLDRL